MYFPKQNENGFVTVFEENPKFTTMEFGDVAMWLKNADILFSTNTPCASHQAAYLYDTSGSWSEGDEVRVKYWIIKGRSLVKA